MSDPNLLPPVDLSQVPSKATLLGQPLEELPKDLYIPPDALEVFLEVFTGPLDLLLYLIKKENLDILDIPIAQVTSQYMAYVDLMKDLDLELAAGYLVMAAVLAEIKSRMLLPSISAELAQEDEADPRAELVRKLREYERFKLAAQRLDQLPRLGREVFVGKVHAEVSASPAPLPKLEWHVLLKVFQELNKRLESSQHYQIFKPTLSVKERINSVLVSLQQQKMIRFQELLHQHEGRAGVVVTLVAILELVRQRLVDCIQADDCYGPIYLQLLNHHDKAKNDNYKGNSSDQ